MLRRKGAKTQREFGLVEFSQPFSSRRSLSFQNIPRGFLGAFASLRRGLR